MLIDSQAMVLLSKIINSNNSVSLYKAIWDSCVYILKVGEESFEASNPSQAILTAYNSLFANSLNNWESFTIRISSKDRYIVTVDEKVVLDTQMIDRIAEKMVTDPSGEFIYKLTKLLSVEDNTTFRFEKKGKYITLREKRPNENFSDRIVVNTNIKELLNDAIEYFSLRDKIVTEVELRGDNFNKSTEMIAQLYYQLKQLSLLPKDRKELK